MGNTIVVLENKAFKTNVDENAILLGMLVDKGDCYIIEALTDDQYKKALKEYKELKNI